MLFSRASNLLQGHFLEPQSKGHFYYLVITVALFKLLSFTILISFWLHIFPPFPHRFHYNKLHPLLISDQRTKALSLAGSDFDDWQWSSNIRFLDNRYTTLYLFYRRMPSTVCNRSACKIILKDLHQTKSTFRALMLET